MPSCLQPPGHTPYPSKEVPVPPAPYWDGVAADGGGEKEEKEKGREEGGGQWEEGVQGRVTVEKGTSQDLEVPDNFLWDS